MIAYVLKSALALAMFYSVFTLLLSRETLHRFNRAMLLGIVVLSMVLPAVHVQTHRQTMAGQVAHAIGKVQAQPLSALSVEVEPDANLAYVETSAPLPTNEADGFALPVSLAAIYLLGVGIALVLFSYRTAILFRLLRKGHRISDAHGNTIILKGGNCPPFSFWHYIVLSVGDYEHNRRSILAHEQEHIRLHHSYDLLLLQVVKTVQWFNPFVYLLERDLRAVHEYQADEAVIRQGIDAKQYQILLVTKAVGMRLQPLANSLSRSKLKNRILMMKRKQSSPLASLKAACLLPVVALSLMASAQVTNDSQNNPSSNGTGYVYTFERNEKLEYTPQKPIPRGTDLCYEMVEYWLEQHMQYTDEMRRRGIGGNFTVQPYVKADGSFTDVKMDENIDPVLKAEVMRLLRSIPKPLLKGVLARTTREGYVYITISIFDPTLAHQPFNKREKLIVYREDHGKNTSRRFPRYTMSIPLGATYTDANGSSRIIKRRDLIYLNGMASDYFRMGVTTDARLLLDGVPFDKNNLPDLPADSLKEVVFKKDTASSKLHYEGTARGKDVNAVGERFVVELRTR